MSIVNVLYQFVCVKVIRIEYIPLFTFSTENGKLLYRRKIYLARFGKWGKLGILSVVVYIYWNDRSIPY
jgi:hypothetical protein